MIRACLIGLPVLKCLKNLSILGKTNQSLFLTYPAYNWNFFGDSAFPNFNEIVFQVLFFGLTTVYNIVNVNNCSVIHSAIIDFILFFLIADLHVKRPKTQQTCGD